MHCLVAVSHSILRLPGHHSSVIPVYTHTFVSRARTVLRASHAAFAGVFPIGATCFGVHCSDWELAVGGKTDHFSGRACNRGISRRRETQQENEIEADEVGDGESGGARSFHEQDGNEVRYE